ncbi:hypothetical protein CEXT_409401 [Caerostris extrusa]|uniref:Uncharacterized protein n=1 Tax=Caerostris extrusa TaxID=172846 RepID=A0AAV4RZR7_CAEEX|nr:hypothetical protein CEXT_409401 [Caerostris extrusa]
MGSFLSAYLTDCAETTGSGISARVRAPHHPHVPLSQTTMGNTWELLSDREIAKHSGEMVLSVSTHSGDNGGLQSALGNICTHTREKD